MTEETAFEPDTQASQHTAERLLEHIRGMSRRRSQRVWLFPSAMFVAFTFLVGMGMVSNFEPGWFILTAFALTWGPGLWVWRQFEQTEMRTLETLAACRELYAVGGLLEVVHYSNRRVKQAVQKALLELLPRLTEEHFALLNTSHRETLNALLYGESAEMAMAALCAIEQVGDGASLPYLTSIADGKGIPTTLQHRRSEVQQRAQHIVTVLHERIERQNRANVLLRPSQAPDTPSEQLVRAAFAPSNTPPEELLRPGARQEQDAT